MVSGERLYVIGPVSGEPCDNIDSFYKAEARLERFGYAPVIPHDFIPSGTPWHEAMRISINALTSGDVGGVAHLDCAPSRGSSIEIEVAKACGIPVRNVSDWELYAKSGLEESE